jgi:hypothetical protein
VEEETPDEVEVGEEEDAEEDEETQAQGRRVTFEKILAIRMVPSSLTSPIVRIFTAQESEKNGLKTKSAGQRINPRPAGLYLGGHLKIILCFSYKL